jgi:small neutral amino acid transporter SnatA (MarC family)
MRGTLVGGHALGIFIVGVCVYLCYRHVDPIVRKLGETGGSVVTRLPHFSFCSPI